MSEEIETTEPIKRLKESDWLVITALWERGEVTLSELSDKFKITKAALSQGLKRRGAVRGSKAHIATKKIQDKIESEKEKLVEDIYNFKKRFIGYGDYLVNMALDTLKEAKASGSPGAVAACRAELASISEATKTFKTIRNDMFHLYDLYDKEKEREQQENYNFNVGVYSEKDIEALREAQAFIDAEESKKISEEDEDFSDDEEDYEGI